MYEGDTVNRERDFPTVSQITLEHVLTQRVKQSTKYTA